MPQNLISFKNIKPKNKPPGPYWVKRGKKRSCVRNKRNVMKENYNDFLANIYIV